MRSHEKTVAPLLELGDLTKRRTRPENVAQVLRTALLVTEADAAVFLSPSARRGERLLLHTGSAAPVIVPAHGSASEVIRLFNEACGLLALPDLSYRTTCAECDSCPGVEAGPVLFAPVRQRDPALGYLAVYRKRGRIPFDLADSRTVLLLSAWLALALETLRLSSGVEKLTVTDGLTDVYNARFLRTALHRELRRAGRFGQELSLVLVQMDHIEEYKAEHGELRTSAVLRELASLLARQVRAFDLVACARGDAFMLILPQTGKPGAREVAERLRAAVERTEFAAGTAGTVTASFGMASFPSEGADYKSLVASVERALAEARESGANIVRGLERAA